MHGIQLVFARANTYMFILALLLLTAMPACCMAATANTTYIGVGETTDLHCNYYYIDVGLSWHSSNQSVAYVQDRFTHTNMVTGKEVGTASVTCHYVYQKDMQIIGYAYGKPIYGRVSDSMTINYPIVVKPAPTGVSLPENQRKIALQVGNTYTLTPKLSAGSCCSTYKLTSSNTSVISCSTPMLRIKALKKGTAKVTLTTYNGLSVSCDVTVNDRSALAKTITANKTKSTVGQPITWTVQTTGTYGTPSFVYSVYKGAELVHTSKSTSNTKFTYTPDSFGIYSVSVKSSCNGQTASAESEDTQVSAGLTDPLRAQSVELPASRFYSDCPITARASLSGSEGGASVSIILIQREFEAGYVPTTVDEIVEFSVVTGGAFASCTLDSSEELVFTGKMEPAKERGKRCYAVAKVSVTNDNYETTAVYSDIFIIDPGVPVTSFSFGSKMSAYKKIPYYVVPLYIGESLPLQFAIQPAGATNKLLSVHGMGITDEGLMRYVDISGDMVATGLKPASSTLASFNVGNYESSLAINFNVKNKTMVKVSPALSVIGTEAFKGAAFEGLDLRPMDNASGEKRIDSGAFRNCAKLDKVRMPKCAITIADDAFEGCSEALTFHVYANTGAEAYAIAHGIPCVYDQ